MMRIGIIDSGIGGYQVSKELKENDIDVVLIMDKAYFPYGSKSKEFLCKRIFYLCKYLEALDVDMIILACNTASIYTLEFIKRNINKPVYGVFDLLIPYLYGNGVFIGSKASVEYVKENYPINTIDGTILIEKIQKQESYHGVLNEYIKRYINYDYIVLGCTHLLKISPEDYLIKNYNQLEELKKNIITDKKILDFNKCTQDKNKAGN